MNKKTKLRIELDAALKTRTPGVDDCSYPGCKQHFTCELARESHYKLNPSHNPFLKKGLTEKTDEEKQK